MTSCRGMATKQLGEGEAAEGQAAVIPDVLQREHLSHKPLSTV